MPKFELNIAVNGWHWVKVNLGDDEVSAKHRAATLKKALTLFAGIEGFEFRLTKWSPSIGTEVADW